MSAAVAPETYLKNAYLGELGGEAFFRGLAEFFPARGDSIDLLARVEARTAAYLAAADISAPADEATAAIERGRVAASVYRDASWEDFLQKILPVIEAATARFETAAARAPKNHVAAYRRLTDHEQALLDFIRLELDGQSGDSALERYLSS